MRGPEGEPDRRADVAIGALSRRRLGAQAGINDSTLAGRPMDAGRQPAHPEPCGRSRKAEALRRLALPRRGASGGRRHRRSQSAATRRSSGNQRFDAGRTANGRGPPAGASRGVRAGAGRLRQVVGRAGRTTRMATEWLWVAGREPGHRLECGPDPGRSRSRNRVIRAGVAFARPYSPHYSMTRHALDSGVAATRRPSPAGRT